MTVVIRQDSNDAVVGRALDELRGLLPPGWTVKRAEGPDRDADVPDEYFSIGDRSGVQRGVLVDVRPDTSPAELDRAYNESVNRRLRRGNQIPVLVVSRYLSPRDRQILESAEVNYLDLTGNARIVIDHPGLFVRTEGAKRSPVARRRVDRGISGPAAGRIVRALTDFAPPYSVTRLAGLAGVSPGYCSRTLQALEREALVERDNRGMVREVDWPAMLRRRGNAVPLFDRERTDGYISRSGVEGTLDVLRGLDATRYAVTGSFAAARIRPVAAPVGLAVYSPDPDTLARSLNLLPAERGADVQLVRPANEGVFTGAVADDGVCWVAPSQVVLDCLGGTGRMPQEGEAVLEWMIENERDWRIVPGASS